MAYDVIATPWQHCLCGQSLSICACKYTWPFMHALLSVHVVVIVCCYKECTSINLSFTSTSLWACVLACMWHYKWLNSQCGQSLNNFFACTIYNCSTNPFSSCDEYTHTKTKACALDMDIQCTWPLDSMYSFFYIYACGFWLQCRFGIFEYFV